MGLKKGISFGLTIIVAFISIMMYSSDFVIAADDDYAEFYTKVEFLESARDQLGMINKLRTGADAWYWNSDNKTKKVFTDLKPLTYDYDLEKVAMQRAVEVAMSYGHVRTDGTSCFTAYSEMNYNRYSSAENVAAGYFTSQQVFEGWKEDEDNYAGQGHRRNMLNPSYNAVGCAGVYYEGIYYWVEEFAYNPGVINTAKTTISGENVEVKFRLVKSYIKDNKISFVEPNQSITMVRGDVIDLGRSKMNLSIKEHWAYGYFMKDVYPYEYDGVYTSSDNNVVSVDGSKITAKRNGTATLTQSVFGVTRTVTVTVEGKYKKTKTADVDGNGMINSVDAVMIKQYLAGYELGEFNDANADINGDGIVDTLDGVMLMQYLAGYDVNQIEE